VSLVKNEVNIDLKLPNYLRNFREFDAVAKMQAAQAWNCSPDQFDLKYPAAVLLKPQVTVSAVTPEEAQQLRARRLTLSKKIGFGFAIALLSILVGIAIATQQLKREATQLQTQTTAIQSGQAERQRRAQELEDLQRREAVAWQKIGQHLQTDLNPLFTTLESLQIPQIKLRAFSFESASQTVQATYELMSLNQLPALERHMQKNTDVIFWQLKSISQQGQGIQTLWMGRI
jgi:hypothetical protein